MLDKFYVCLFFDSETSHFARSYIEKRKYLRKFYNAATGDNWTFIYKFNTIPYVMKL